MSKLVGFLIGIPIALVIFLPGPFWEAWVALKIVSWHVPALGLPAWLTWWTLGWLNVAVCTIIRQYPWKPLDVEEKGLDNLRRLWSIIKWQYATPLLALIIAWVVKEIID